MLYRPPYRLPARAIAVGLLVSTTLIPAVAHAGSVKLVATLSGAEEVKPGKPDGTGGFKVELDPDTNDFCYSLWGDNIGTPTMAHLHSGVAGVNGPLVVTLDVTGKEDDACIAVDKEKLDPIVATPSAFYINIHTAEFPDGAVRGQLAKAPKKP